ncbi:MAG: hypothetical protein GY915_04135 [bacterium]|nr:hypothetical protein [bacterium]
MVFPRMTSNEERVQKYETQLTENRAKIKNGVTDADKANAFSKEFFKNKDDYIKLFLTQMQCQTPDKPMDPADMMAALGQMAAVESARGNREAAEKLVTLQKQSQMIAMAGHKGSFMEVEGQKFYHAPWDAPRLVYELPEGIEKTSVTIFNEKGDRVAELSGPVQAGRNEVIWDGKDFKGGDLPKGKYRFNVQMFGKEGKAPVDAEGNIVVAKHRSMMRVTGVKMVSGVPMGSSYDLDVPMSAVSGLSAEGVVDLEKKSSEEDPEVENSDGLTGEDLDRILDEALDELDL